MITMIIYYYTKIKFTNVTMTIVHMSQNFLQILQHIREHIHQKDHMHVMNVLSEQIS